MEIMEKKFFPIKPTNLFKTLNEQKLELDSKKNKTQFIELEYVI
jgi:hypothetical protein